MAARKARVKKVIIIGGAYESAASSVSWAMSSLSFSSRNTPSYSWFQQVLVVPFYCLEILISNFKKYFMISKTALNPHIFCYMMHILTKSISFYIFLLK